MIIFSFSIFFLNLYCVVCAFCKMEILYQILNAYVGLNIEYSREVLVLRFFLLLYDINSIMSGLISYSMNPFDVSHQQAGSIRRIYMCASFSKRTVTHVSLYNKIFFYYIFYYIFFDL